jgi:formate/nitrite transporter FocA (FNT family)
MRRKLIHVPLVRKNYSNQCNVVNGVSFSDLSLSFLVQQDTDLVTWNSMKLSVPKMSKVPSLWLVETGTCTKIATV